MLLNTDPRHLEAAAERCQDGASLWPRIISIHPTDRCNHSCDWCWYSRSTQSIDIGATVATLEVCASRGVDELVISGGGEPLVHPEIDVLIRYLTEIRGVQRRLYTNGSLVHRHQAIADAFDYVRVSLDVGGAQLYAQAHGTSARKYGQILTWLADLSKCGVNVGVSAVVLGSEERSIRELLSDCERYGVPRLFLKPRLRRLAHDPMPSFVFELKSTDVEVTVRTSVALTPKRHGITSAPLSLAAMNVFVAADSRLYPCCHLTGEDWSFGQAGENVARTIGGLHHQNILRRYWRMGHPCWAHEAWRKLASNASSIHLL